MPYSWKRDVSPCPRCGGDTFVVSELAKNPNTGKIEDIATVICQREGIAFVHNFNDALMHWLNSYQNKILKIKVIDKNNLINILVEIEKSESNPNLFAFKEEDCLDKLSILSDPNWKCDLNDVSEIFLDDDGLLEIRINNL